MTWMRRRGFTFVELMISITIVGFLASIAVPKYRDFKRKAYAARIVGDFDVIRIAAVSFYADSGYYPAEAATGAVPPNMDKYLPLNFKFVMPDWQLDYEHWQVAPLPGFSQSGNVIGIAVNTANAPLGETTLRMLGNSPTFTNGANYTLVIIGM
jgi:prepilin-type N-terminal cleavage/methylation domain-containing protein